MHDAHDGTLAMADAWLKLYIRPVLRSPYFKPGATGVMFVTFDNGNGDAQGQVFTAVIGPRVNAELKWTNTSATRTLCAR